MLPDLIPKPISRERARRHENDGSNFYSLQSLWLLGNVFPLGEINRSVPMKRTLAKPKRRDLSCLDQLTHSYRRRDDAATAWGQKPPIATEPIDSRFTSESRHSRWSSKDRQLWANCDIQTEISPTESHDFRLRRVAALE
ncbi:hypothetical protein [Bradyrhizobium sp. USDA 3256]